MVSCNSSLFSMDYAFPSPSGGSSLKGSHQQDRNFGFKIIYTVLEYIPYHTTNQFCSNISLYSMGFMFQDEKLQDVLGHFQKDFEAGVSAENLGEHM